MTAGLTLCSKGDGMSVSKSSGASMLWIERERN